MGAESEKEKFKEEKRENVSIVDNQTGGTSFNFIYDLIDCD